MSERKKKPKTSAKASSLSEAARALRAKEAAGQPADHERTTLNVSDPEVQENDAGQPDALGEALVQCGVISRHQLFNALNESYRSGTTLREALTALKMVDEAALSRFERKR